jgi:hypothetical protein
MYFGIEMVKYLEPRQVVILEIYKYTYRRKETFTRKYAQTQTRAQERKQAEILNSALKQRGQMINLQNASFLYLTF